MAAEYGLTPTQTDALSIGEIAVMQVGAIRRRLERLEHTGLLLDGLLNYGGMRGEGFVPVRFGRHYRDFLGLPETEGAVSHGPTHGPQAIAGLKERHPEWFTRAEA